MQKANDETLRRREKQVEANEAAGITPQTVMKNVADIMEGARIPGKKISNKSGRKVAEAVGEYDVEPAMMPPAQLIKTISKLEDRMDEASKNLEFEQAARIRDEIQRLNSHVLR